MGLSSLGFLVDDAGKSIRRNGLMSLAALTTVAISLAVFGGALFTLHRIHQLVAAQPRQLEIAVFMRVRASRERAREAQRAIQALPGVARASLVTKEEALRQMEVEDRSGGESIAAALEGNPLPDRIDVALSDPARTPQVAAALKDRKRFAWIEAVRDDRATLDKLIATSRLVRNVGIAIAALLFAATAFVIQNTIRMTVVARRREIRIMQLVGATPGFIRLPLVLEGVFYGVAGACIAGGLVLFIIRQVSAYMDGFRSPLAQALPRAAGPLTVLGLLVATGAALGLLGSVLSIRRFLRKA
ncbi:MAG: ABC transporter permease [Chthonomonadales bacterium]|nr:ABC transporter permease [Chthonomonadales bacterium]